MTKSSDITPELQIEINRRLWIQALRENGHRQCKGVSSKGLVCAMNLAPEFIVRLPGKSMQHSLGMHNDGSRDLLLAARDNDAGWTFARIADAAEQGRYW